jgi:hypothetical protein
MWWPDLNLQLHVGPIIDLHTGCAYRRYDRLTFDVFCIHVSLFTWKTKPFIHFVFDLYRREYKP